MKVIILGAGLGTRIGTLTKKIPKCLIPFNNSTLLEISIKKLRELGIEDITVVTGYMSDKVKKIYNKVIVNENYTTTEAPYSLRLALNKMEQKDDIIVLDADLIFEIKLLAKIKNINKSLLVTYYAKSKTENGSRVEIQKEKIISVGRYISPQFPYQICAGITKILAKDFDYYKELANQEVYKSLEMDVLLNDFCKAKDLYVLNIDKKSVKKYTEKLSLEGGSFSNIVTTKNDNFIRKETTKDTKRLINEISYLTTLPKNLKSYFPEIIDYNITGEKVWYVMKHYEQSSLKKLILSNYLNAGNIIPLLLRIVEFLKENVYNLNQIKTTSIYIDSVHFYRVYSRKDMSINKAPIFKDIFDAEKVILNGIEYENIIPLINKIIQCKKLLTVLTPPYLSKIHGDLHLDNILIDITKNPYEFRFVDPKGFLKGDPMYDISKLLHDFNGLYSFIYEYMFDLKWSKENNNIKAKLNIKNCQSLDEYCKVKEYFPIQLNKIFKDDKYWYLRAKFIEAINFSSLQPFHIVGDNKESKAIAMYLIGVKLLNYFWDSLDPELKIIDKEYKVININTIEDYTHAQNLFKENES